jgi:hypothetical protein
MFELNPQKHLEGIGESTDEQIDADKNVRRRFFVSAFFCVIGG